MTLVELIVVMVVISVALAGVMSVINYTTLYSADPVLRRQAIAIAEAYMEEITLKSYLDPDDGTLCPGNEGNRALYDNVCDYNGLADSGAHDQNDNAIGGLDNYSVNVSVVAQSYGPAGATVAGLKIDVVVIDPGNESLTLSGYRTSY